MVNCKPTATLSDLILCFVAGSVLLFLSGCSLLSAPAEPASAEEMQSPYLPLINADSVAIRIVYVNGVEPPEGSVEQAFAGFEKYLAGEVDLLEPQFVRSETSPPVLSRAEFEGLVKEHAGRGSNTITIFVAPQLAFFNRRGFYQYTLSRGGDERHIIALCGDAIDATADKVPFLSRGKLWRIVLLHEMCHALGVPSDPSHTWRDCHCTHPECILYPAIDSRSILVSVLRLGPPQRLCAVCQDEIREAKESVEE